MKKVIGYCRISTTVQDLDIQKQVLMEYARINRLVIDEFIESESSSRLKPKERKIDELVGKLAEHDILLVVELSRLGRNMLETLNIINELTEKGIKIIFIRQPELSTTSPHGKLLMAIYSYFAETEREYISMRTKQGLITARAKGALLGRPRGSKNANGTRFDPYRTEIKKYIKMKIPVSSILKILNSKMKEKISYTALSYFIENNDLN